MPEPSERDKRVREWRRLMAQIADNHEMERWHMLYALVLADRGEARSKEAREIADSLCMSWGRIEARQFPSGVKR